MMAPALSPRERIIEAAQSLFYREGIRGIGVEAIASAANTNKMAIYRHFDTKDDLVVHWLTSVADEYEQMWSHWENLYPGDPASQLRALVLSVVQRLRSKGNRGCALANSLAELPDEHHPARKVIDRHKKAQVQRIQALCSEAGLKNPEHCAMVLHLCFEGAQVAAQSLGADLVAAHLEALVDALLETRGAARPRNDAGSRGHGKALGKK
ncbi:TetR/AcrR family transcriptional regulator [Paraburkholderia adhaesiva]|uniref:TetR/AcrR family transcriptional regulator n=1 Tax=Paraburkholderia adhaesiva TaxID=2883244 RepID=UPI001F2B29D4|nr:TetR/AcrR family transcriptional regulator [Paraburkholderia adhaesiva]